MLDRNECENVFQRYVIGTQLNKLHWILWSLNILTIFLPFFTLVLLNCGIVRMLRKQNIQVCKKFFQFSNFSKKFQFFQKIPIFQKKKLIFLAITIANGRVSYRSQCDERAKTKFARSHAHVNK